MAQNKERPSLERCLRPGWYIFWQHQTYRIIDRDQEHFLSVRVENEVTGEQQTIRIEELMLVGKDDSYSRPLFAPTLEQLHKEIHNLQPLPEIGPTNNLPQKLLAKADRIISVVEQVEARMQEEEEKLGEKFKRREALKDACALIKPEKVKPITYYKYRRLYRKCYGDRAHFASSLRRSTYMQIKLQKAQLHFLDTMIPLYYREDRATKASMVYKLSESAIKLHTNGYWVDPSKCKKEVPKNLLDELIKVLGQELPMQAILDNPEKEELLSPIEMPSLGFFYEYFRWFEALPQRGRNLMNSRYGKGTWEQLYMVFDAFVQQATFPLQYVFADHYLLDAFIVDEAARNKIDRLWVTILIDAYSRSILGMALFYEEPCIDSIQSALLHAIWPKTSHKELGIDGEWVCFGIPQQLSLDNAWAHHSHSLENLARTIGHGGKYHTIDLVFRPPYKARYGALVESFFGNLSGRIKQELPGAIQSSDPKHVRDAARKACLLYEDVYRYLQ